MISRAAIALAILLTTGLAGTQETVQEFSWSSLQSEGRLISGRVVPADSTSPFEALVVENTEDWPVTITVLVVEHPRITAQVCALRGSVSNEGVEGRVYVDLWSYYPDGNRYASGGPMPGGHGLRQPREPAQLDLPVAREPAKGGMPELLVVNVVFLGKGTVRLGPLRLVQYEAVRPWWSDRQGGLIGGLFGLIFGGGFGGGFSVLASVLCNRGKARRFVLGSLLAVAALGLVMVGVGIVALKNSQPYAVYYPLLLTGGLISCLLCVMFFVFRERYKRVELRKMQVRDT